MRYLDFKKFSIYYDPYLIISISLLSILGLFFLYSASDGNAAVLIKQSIFVFFGLILMIVLNRSRFIIHIQDFSAYCVS